VSGAKTEGILGMATASSVCALLKTPGVGKFLNLLLICWVFFFSFLALHFGLLYHAQVKSFSISHQPAQICFSSQDAYMGNWNSL
jgi:hypothetical protein